MSSVGSDVLPPPPARPARALAAALLLWSLAVVLLVTLAPFRFRLPTDLRLSFAAAPFELAVNCVLLAIPGALFRALVPAPRDRYCVGPFLFGVAVSAAIELAQSAVPGRVPSPVDVAANAAGAWFGAMTLDAARRNLALHLADHLLLDLPLMGVVYLLVPLLWIAGEAAAENGRRLLLVLPLGLTGGGIVAVVWRRRLRPAGVLSPGGIALVAAGWFLAAAAPALRHRPGLLAATTAVVASLTWLAARSPRFVPDAERRFELPTLRRVGPLYAVYLAVICTWPAPAAAADGAAGPALVALPDLGSPPRMVPLWRLVEHFAAFTLAGYLVAESRGRRDERPGATVLHAVGTTAAFAAVLEAARTLGPDAGATLLRPGLATVAATFGATIYVRQRAAVRHWIATRRDAAQAGEAAPASMPRASETFHGADAAPAGDVPGRAVTEPVAPTLLEPAAR